MPLSKDQIMSSIHNTDLQTCLDAHAQWVSFNWMFIYKYKLSQKKLCLR